MKKTVFISAGSSGGHIFPALSLAKHLTHLGHHVYFIASATKLEGKIVPQYGFTLINITSPTLRKPFKGFTRFLVELLRSISDSLHAINSYKPDIVISFGGAVTFSVALASFLKRKPLYLHEQNAVMGLTNECVSILANTIFTQFKLNSFWFKHKMVHVGSPRTSDFRHRNSDTTLFTSLGFKSDKPLVVFVMGSLGSFTMQKIITDMVSLYPHCDFQRLVVTGSRYFDKAKQYDSPATYTRIVESVSLFDLYPFITLLVTRAGATTMAELIGSGTPSIVIPSPFVPRNHQMKNALFLSHEQATHIVHETCLNAHALHNHVETLVRDTERLYQMKASLSRLTQFKEIEKMVEYMGL